MQCKNERKKLMKSPRPSPCPKVIHCLISATCLPPAGSLMCSTDLNYVLNQAGKAVGGLHTGAAASSTFILHDWWQGKGRGVGRAKGVAQGGRDGAKGKKQDKASTRRDRQGFRKEKIVENKWHPIMTEV